jgi:hypothetical protein
MFIWPLRYRNQAAFTADILGILTKYKVLPNFAQQVLAPVTPSSCGIGSIINRLGY